MILYPAYATQALKISVAILSLNGHISFTQWERWRNVGILRLLWDLESSLELPRLKISTNWRPTNPALDMRKFTTFTNILATTTANAFLCASTMGGLSEKCNDIQLSDVHFLSARCSDGCSGRTNSALDLKACMGIEAGGTLERGPTSGLLLTCDACDREPRQSIWTIALQVALDFLPAAKFVDDVDGRESQIVRGTTLLEYEVYEIWSYDQIEFQETMSRMPAFVVSSFAALSTAYSDPSSAEAGLAQLSS
ncbi:hypothetical protein BJ165DRAFT_1528565 [Panaeolus papilionaceus]|nr:hypothetical protein BJ165DRAFT_1528565 [Panaeolus papilionaceus]